MQCPSFQQNFKHSSAPMNLKCINVYYITSGVYYITCLFEVHKFDKN